MNTPIPTNQPIPAMDSLIPLPVSVNPAGSTFTLTAATTLYVQPADDELLAIGRYLAGKLRPATGLPLPVEAASSPPPAGHLYLTTTGSDPALGEEGYELTITADGLTLIAPHPAGLFHGIQTIRQLLPPAVEAIPSPSQGEGQGEVTPSPSEGEGWGATDPWQLPTGTIRDYPRYSWRGAMLDVSRHFFAPEDVKRYIDLLAYYKLNRLHLHLSDDQGWRIEIKSWPNLTAHGSTTEVGGGPGGFYTQEEYTGIVAYAQARYITIIPEIDLPGHTNAALASYPELNCDGVAPNLYTGTTVGFSSLCIDKEITYTFVADVVRELAALTPGPYLHIGGDEAQATQTLDYIRFIERVETIVEAQGKRMIGWEEIAQAELLPTSIAQQWFGTQAVAAAQQGASVIVSPASRAYLDMKYLPDSPLGLDWAGLTEVDDAYTWDPATQVIGLPEAAILGIEAPLWTETVETMADIEWLAFPRLAGLAEIGWTPQEQRQWNNYKLRLAAHGPRLTALGVNFYRSPRVPWQ